MTEMLNQDSRPEDDHGITREAWLHQVGGASGPERPALKAVKKSDGLHTVSQSRLRQALAATAAAVGHTFQTYFAGT
jgi:hypothetical protein